MASFNKVILMGNLTRDPEMRVTPGGLSICKLGLAVNRNYTTRDGERREETTFVDIDAFDKQAEVIAKYMSKGSPILVEDLMAWLEGETLGQRIVKIPELGKFRPTLAYQCGQALARIHAIDVPSAIKDSLSCVSPASLVHATNQKIRIRL